MPECRNMLGLLNIFEINYFFSALLVGAFHYAWPSGWRPVELTKEKWNNIFHQKSISARTEAFHLRF